MKLEVTNQIQFTRYSHHRDRGFIAASVVIIVLAVVLAIGSTGSFLAVGAGQSSLAISIGENTLAFVEGCVEDALLKSRASSSYAGGNISRPEGTCTVNVSKNGAIWTLTVSTTDSEYKRSVEAIINRNSSGVILTSWTEI